jgi:hypothetical protein
MSWLVASSRLISRMTSFRCVLLSVLRATSSASAILSRSDLSDEEDDKERYWPSNRTNEFRHVVHRAAMPPGRP